MLTTNHAELTAQVAAHVEADALIAGHYWNAGDNAVGGFGCFIGCLAHSSDAKVLEDRFGFPLPLTRIAESIFEALPADERKAFFAAIPGAVGCDGKDLSLVHWKFLLSELKALPPQTGDCADAVATVIAGIGLLAAGETWHKDAYAAYAAADAASADAAYATAYATAYAAASAAYAADAAYATADAAASAAYAAAYAAYAAASADDARIRQRNTLLALIADAPVREQTQ